MSLKQAPTHFCSDASLQSFPLGVRWVESAEGVKLPVPVLPARAPSTISLIQFTSSEV